jgi:aspartyl-tRNA(Asn)/glutamyl-tRNA(Gln) amidotransferase subunit A
MLAEVRRLLVEAVDVLRGSGVEIVDVPMPILDDLAACANVILGSEAATLHGAWLRTRADDYGRQVRRRIERGLLYPATRYLDALRLRGPLLREFLAQYLPKGADALVLPTMPEPAPTIAEANGPDEDENERRFASFSYWTRAINYLGCPALSAPMGFVDGLPVGLQLVGRPSQEAALLRLAHRYEAEARWPMIAPT